MELRLFQFFYMMSLDLRNQCDGHMLAKAVQNFSKHIVQRGRTRRQEPNTQTRRQEPNTQMLGRRLLMRSY